MTHVQKAMRWGLEPWRLLRIPNYSQIIFQMALLIPTHQLAHPVNFGGSRDEVSGEEGSDCGDVFKVGCGGVGDDDEVFFD